MGSVVEFQRPDGKALQGYLAEAAVAALPVCKATSALQAFSDTRFAAQPLLVQRMVQG